MTCRFMRERRKTKTELKLIKRRYLPHCCSDKDLKKGYRCESGIPLNLEDTINYADIPFRLMLFIQCAKYSVQNTVCKIQCAKYSVQNSSKGIFQITFPIVSYFVFQPYVLIVSYFVSSLMC